jgi:hypothetical protein
MKAILVGLSLRSCKLIILREILIRQVDKGDHLDVEVAIILPVETFNKRQNQ